MDGPPRERRASCETIASADRCATLSASASSPPNGATTAPRRPLHWHTHTACLYNMHDLRIQPAAIPPLRRARARVSRGDLPLRASTRTRTNRRLHLLERDVLFCSHGDAVPTPIPVPIPVPMPEPDGRRLTPHSPSPHPSLLDPVSPPCNATRWASPSLSVFRLGLPYPARARSRYLALPCLALLP